MSIEALLNGVRELSDQDRELFLERLHEEFPDREPELSDDLKALLDQRLAEADANPDAGIPWEVVKARSLKRIQK